MKTKIEVIPYQTEWKNQFEDIAHHLREVLPNSIIGIEHVGSTSVPGLLAKPIIDLDIVIADDKELREECIKALADLGYKHLGNLGITGRDAFSLIELSDAQKWPQHHLYLCINTSLGYQNHITLRNHLRKHPADVVKYGQLKEELAQQFPFDIDAYVEGKSDFIANILLHAGMDNDWVGQIKFENKAE